MKKLSKMFLSLLCLILLCGCDIYVYDVGDKDNSNNNQQEALHKQGKNKYNAHNRLHNSLQALFL